jgi:hypothetical protein
MNTKLFNITVKDGLGAYRDFAVAAADPMEAREKAEALGWIVASRTIFQIDDHVVTGGTVHKITHRETGLPTVES